MTTTAKERPILMMGELVVATLEGRKDVTRRPVTRLLGFGPITDFGPSDTPGYDWRFRDRRMLWHDLRHDDVLARCPFGIAGRDRLWFKETHYVESAGNADGTGRFVIYRTDEGAPVSRWTPSILMRRENSRCLVDVLDVDLVRLGEITAEEVEREGFQFDARCSAVTRCATFLRGWDGMYGKTRPEQLSERDPVVWRIQYRRVET